MTTPGVEREELHDNLFAQWRAEHPEGDHRAMYDTFNAGWGAAELVRALHPSPTGVSDEGVERVAEAMRTAMGRLPKEWSRTTEQARETWCITARQWLQNNKSLIEAAMPAPSPELVAMQEAAVEYAKARDKVGWERFISVQHHLHDTALAYYRSLPRQEGGQ